LGSTESLNASVATGIILYDAVRQRLSKWYYPLFVDIAKKKGGGLHIQYNFLRQIVF
jgi:hypothetical protein